MEEMVKIGVDNLPGNEGRKREVSFYFGVPTLFVHAASLSWKTLQTSDRKWREGVVRRDLGANQRKL